MRAESLAGSSGTKNGTLFANIINFHSKRKEIEGIFPNPRKNAERIANFRKIFG